MRTGTLHLLRLCNYSCKGLFDLKILARAASFSVDHKHTWCGFMLVICPMANRLPELKSGPAGRLLPILTSLHVREHAERLCTYVAGGGHGWLALT